MSANRLPLAASPHRIFIDQPTRISRILARLVQVASHVDLIQLNLPTPAFSLLADLLQSLVRVPVLVGYEAHLVHLHDLWQDQNLYRSLAFYLPRLLINNRLVARVTWQRAAGYIVNSGQQKNELVALGIPVRRIHLLPTVLPSDKWVRRERTSMRSAFPPGRLVTYVGHYNPVKGVDVLVEAFRLIAPRFPDAHLVLAWSGVGANRSVDELLSDAVYQDRVLQLGQVSVTELLSASDVVVLPYRLSLGQAAHPTTLIETFAANVPVVTTDLPIYRELMQEFPMALLVPPNDPRALAQAIEKILSDSDLVRQMLTAQRRWSEQAQPACVIQSYEQLYAQVLHASEARILPSD